MGATQSACDSVGDRPRTEKQIATTRQFFTDIEKKLASGKLCNQEAYDAIVKRAKKAPAEWRSLAGACTDATLLAQFSNVCALLAEHGLTAGDAVSAAEEASKSSKSTKSTSTRSAKKSKASCSTGACGLVRSTTGCGVAATASAAAASAALTASCDSVKSVDRSLAASAEAAAVEAKLIAEAAKAKAELLAKAAKDQEAVLASALDEKRKALEEARDAAAAAQCEAEGEESKAKSEAVKAKKEAAKLAKGIKRAEIECNENSCGERSLDAKASLEQLQAEEAAAKAVIAAAEQRIKDAQAAQKKRAAELKKAEQDCAKVKAREEAERARIAKEKADAARKAAALAEKEAKAAELAAAKAKAQCEEKSEEIANLESLAKAHAAALEKTKAEIAALEACDAGCSDVMKLRADAKAKKDQAELLKSLTKSVSGKCATEEDKTKLEQLTNSILAASKKRCALGSEDAEVAAYKRFVELDRLSADQFTAALTEEAAELMRKFPKLQQVAADFRRFRVLDLVPSTEFTVAMNEEATALTNKYPELKQESIDFQRLRFLNALPTFSTAETEEATALLKKYPLFKARLDALTNKSGVTAGMQPAKPYKFASFGTPQEIEAARKAAMTPEGAPAKPYKLATFGTAEEIEAARKAAMAGQAAPTVVTPVAPAAVAVPAAAAVAAVGATVAAALADEKTLLAGETKVVEQALKYRQALFYLIAAKNSGDSSQEQAVYDRVRKAYGVNVLEILKEDAKDLEQRCSAVENPSADVCGQQGCEFDGQKCYNRDFYATPEEVVEWRRLRLLHEQVATGRATEAQLKQYEALDLATRQLLTMAAISNYDEARRRQYKITLGDADADTFKTHLDEWRASLRKSADGLALLRLFDAESRSHADDKCFAVENANYDNCDAQGCEFYTGGVASGATCFDGELQDETKSTMTGGWVSRAVKSDAPQRKRADAYQQTVQSETKLWRSLLSNFAGADAKVSFAKLQQLKSGNPTLWAEAQKEPNAYIDLQTGKVAYFTAMPQDFTALQKAVNDEKPKNASVVKFMTDRIHTRLTSLLSQLGQAAAISGVTAAGVGAALAGYAAQAAATQGPTLLQLV